MARRYDVGYGKPPAAGQFKPGQSGNPRGRPKGSKNLATMVQRALGEKVVVNINGRRRKVSKLEAAFTQQSNRAAAGDPKAMKLMLDILVGAETRDAASQGPDDVGPEIRRQRSAQVLEALKARFETVGGDDDQES